MQWKFSINLFLLVPEHFQCISVSWALAAPLVFLSCVFCLQNPFDAPEIPEVMSKKPMKKGILLM